MLLVFLHPIKRLFGQTPFSLAGSLSKDQLPNEVLFYDFANDIRRTKNCKNSSAVFAHVTRLSVRPYYYWNHNPAPNPIKRIRRLFCGCKQLRERCTETQVFNTPFTTFSPIGEGQPKIWFVFLSNRCSVHFTSYCYENGSYPILNPTFVYRFLSFARGSQIFSGGRSDRIDLEFLVIRSIHNPIGSPSFSKQDAPRSRMRVPIQ